jgi:hypothetical protein
MAKFGRPAEYGLFKLAEKFLRRPATLANEAREGLERESVSRSRPAIESEQASGARPPQERVPSPVVQELMDQAARPDEFWRVSRGAPPSGPIDHLAASPDPDVFRTRLIRKLDDWRKLEKTFPEGGWRMDRNPLFRGDARPRSIVFRDGFTLQGRGPGVEVYTTRDPMVAVGYSRRVYVIDAAGGHGLGDHHQINFFAGIDGRFVKGLMHVPEEVQAKYRLSAWQYPISPDDFEWIPNPGYSP